MSSLAAQEVSCGYGNRRVLESLSLAVQAGEVVSLLGPNGAGKTTLLRALARLLRPTHGTVLLDGGDIWHLGAGALSRTVGLMPQSERRDWPLTVEESVQMGRAPHRGWLLPFNADDARVVDEALRNTSLVDLRQRPITELSGGEWRRVILARALAQQARVLLLDEPIGGLDLRFQVEMLRLVRELAIQEQLAVVLTLHDLNLAAVYSHRIALLSERTLIACGTPEEVLTAELVGRAFSVPVAVTRHPVYGTPLVVPMGDVPQATGA
jgi:ABC-type cobalamin/Fe3+-siderophores transport system ATPase subunit